MTELARLRLEIRGAVQGVGFRPFVYRLAGELGLAGWVRNDARGVDLEVEGLRPGVEQFRTRIAAERPAPAVVQSIAELWLPAAGARGFHIVASEEPRGEAAAAKSAVILPDLAVCDDCRQEVFSAADRRAGYPFTNCTHCGPRFSILEELPYDRPRTTMRGFTMCPACQREYDSPEDRRFHAQPNACPSCGPELRLLAPDGEARARGAAALARAAEALRDGRILALKGIGGYQLLVDARCEPAVARLRELKRRPAKPLAVMARDIAAAADLVEVSPDDARLLASAAAPIVLLERRPRSPLAPSIAPGAPRIGVLLPTTPLHHLLLARLDFPVVATSGNLADEPIAIDEDEALARLGGVADLFLAHDRPIVRHVDDSLAWVLDGTPQLLRRARGYAPLPVLLRDPAPTLLAVGAHQKCAVALSLGRQVFVSQHLGDLETPEARAAFERVIADFLRLYEARPTAIVHDLHPDYVSTRWAEGAVAAQGGLLERAGLPPAGLERIAVQHHHAHLASLLAERQIEGPALAATFDGTGWGPDGTVWGGEFLWGDARSFRRVARLRPFRLPGGEAAVREPRRIALSLLHQVVGPEALADSALPPLDDFTAAERRLLGRLLDDGLRSPWTSSAGRLFDGVAALVGVCPRASFEGEAAMALEALANGDGARPYPLPAVEAPAPAGLAPGQEAAPTLLELDWRPLIVALLADLARGAPRGTVAARFHAAMSEAVLAVARAAAAPRVALTGGCFQNRRLVLESAGRLRAAGFEVLLHRDVPANDGGIALGQIAVAAARHAR